MNKNAYNKNAYKSLDNEAVDLDYREFPMTPSKWERVSRSQNPKPLKLRKRKPQTSRKPSWPKSEDQKKQSRPLIVVHPVRGWTKHQRRQVDLNQPKHVLDAISIEFGQYRQEARDRVSPFSAYYRSNSTTTRQLTKEGVEP